MRWPKPDELQRWTPHDQVVFRKWRRGVILFYGAIFGLLAVTSTFALRHDGPASRDLMARRQALPLSTAAPLPTMYQGR
jgi:hypothetical protein